MPPNGAQAGTHKRRSSLRGQCLRWVKGCFCGDVHGTGPLYPGLCVDAQTGIPLLPEVLICEIATLASPALSQCGAGIWILVLHLTMCGPATPTSGGMHRPRYAAFCANEAPDEMAQQRGRLRLGACCASESNDAVRAVSDPLRRLRFVRPTE
jgi:hypothetical protein